MWTDWNGCYPSALRAGGVLSHRIRRVGGRLVLDLRNAYISETAGRIFSQFEIPRNFLDLKLCSVMIICPFAPFELAYGAKTFGASWVQTLREAYLWNAGQIYSIWSSMELSRPEHAAVVQRHGRVSIFPIDGLTYGPKTCQIWYHWSPNFVEPNSLKPLDGFTPLEWSRLIVVQCHNHLPHLGFPMGQKLTKSGTIRVQILQNVYI